MQNSAADRDGADITASRVAGRRARDLGGSRIAIAAMAVAGALRSLAGHTPARMHQHDDRDRRVRKVECHADRRINAQAA